MKKIWILVSKEGHVVASSTSYNTEADAYEALDKLNEGTAKYLKPYPIYAPLEKGESR